MKGIADAPIVRGFQNARRGLAFARTILRTPITPASAAAAIGTRLAERSAAFLDTLERGVFAYPDSPYRVLMEAAGYDLGRVRSLVAGHGVEAALERLCADGVYITIEEFKGLKEVRRGARTIRVTPDVFDNPLVSGGLAASSGGTRSGGIITSISPSNLRMGAEHLAVAIAAYGLEELPVVVWLASSHGASLWAVLALAAMGRASQWFTTMRPTRSLYLHPYQMAIHGWSRLRGIKLPVPIYVPLTDPSPILPWITRTRPRGCGVFTTPSSALRLALAVRDQGLSLEGVTFITIGEPLTAAKLAGIQGAGGRAFSSLGFTEFGRATYGCASPVGTDDTHICKDAVAVIRRRRTVDRLGSEVDSLLFTSLRPDARKILINMETGDYAALSRRSCGCFLETVGWTEHLEGIRSFEKLNAEGRLFFGSQLIELIEEVLPQRIGGDPTDYQLLEQEDREGFTRMFLLVHPRLGPIDEAALLEYVAQTLRAEHATSAERWNETGTIQVRRQVPVITKAGKLMPLHHLGFEQPDPSNQVR